MTSKYFEQALKICKTAHQEKAFRGLTDFVANHGYPNYFIGYTRTCINWERITCIVKFHTSMHEQWLQEYISKKYLTHDVAVNRIIRQQRLWIWDNLSHTKCHTPTERRIIEGQRECGFIKGFANIFHHPEVIGGYGFASADKDHPAKPPQELTEQIEALIAILCDRIVEEWWYVTHENMNPLPSKEREVLYMIAQTGGTAATVAAALGKSTRTVERQLMNASNRIGGGSKVRAIGLASKYGWI
ncbi:MAG: autoinducer binding domain-containing protein [Gammaproteobacteria bacterium]|nr:autoinducer binding domain-containing protein [Gammaproteobacteria bacterium]